MQFDELSPKQQEAISINDKHLRIIACAGSGKTTTIAGKVAYLLDPANGYDLKPENIIAFTYTDKAAAELKNKILNASGHYTGMANMYIGTIHGWCLKALQDNIYEYQSFSVLDEIKLKLFIDKYYERIGMKDIAKLSNPAVPLRRFIDTSIFARIMDIVRESDLENELPENIKSAKKKYEQTLLSKKFFDFSMIMDRAIESLKPDSNLTKKIEQSLKYLIVDEYQDVNPIQEKLINKLHEISGCNVVVVGDDDQNIYQWRGSNNKYIINFDKKFNEAEFKNIPLGINYRSSEGITRLAETLIANNIDRIRNKSMVSDHRQSFAKGQDLLFNEYDSVSEENEAIAEYIENIIGVEFSDREEKKRGLAYSDIAILLRTWSKAETIVEELDKHNIPYITAGVNQLFETPEVEGALGIYYFLYGDIEADELIKLWTKLPNNRLDVKKLKMAVDNLSKRKPDLNTVRDNWEYSLQDILWEFIVDGEIYEDNFIDDSNSEILKKSREKAEIIFFNLGKFSQVINDFEEINFNSVSPARHLFSFLSFITYAARDYYPQGWLNNPYKTPNAVQIMTIHQAKGLEFPVVIIPGLNKNYLPSKKKGGLNEWHFLDRALISEQPRYEGNDDKEDERRLLYVAITRSQKYLLLSRAPDLDNRLYRVESQFAGELRRANVLVQDKKEDFSSQLKIDSKPKEKIKNISLDFTTLKDFFDCPYRFKLVSMYGFKFPLNQRMGVGRSFHNALMEIHKRAQKQEELNTKDLIRLVERQTNFPYLTKSTKLKRPLWRKVRNNVVDYYEDNKDDFDNIEFVEQDIQYKLDENILVLGRIDLIKKRNESGKFETTIVEFKSEDKPIVTRVTKDQLKLYALGHRELTGQRADYIMTYIIGENNPKTPEKLLDSDLNEIEDKIKSAVEKIRDEDFTKVEDKEKCDSCYENRLCYYRLKYNSKCIR
ncbi:MAG: hypothetical protein BGO69_19465 [Bacteroidetes bacterium 46-16]|mgnify:CR=1 FL=1|nr:MAG: hypothetical protein BGO69_19465 [Bacteroidetes bacterium 46-16]